MTERNDDGPSIPQAEGVPLSTVRNKQDRLQVPPSRSRRIVSTRRVIPELSEEQHDYTGLLQKTWRVYSLSALYNFRHDSVSLKKYATSLDAALSQVKASEFNLSGGGSEKSSFSVYKGLSFHSNDAEAVQIQVTERNASDKGPSIVLNAILMCVDLEESPVPSNLASHFTYYPVVLVMGNKARTSTVLSWLESHFDCRSDPVSFSDNDLRWMFAAGISQDSSCRPLPVLMQYSLSDVCDGIKTIDCKFESIFCKELWDRLQEKSSSQGIITEEEVNRFMDSLEEHLEYTMNIIFRKLSLSEVGTPAAYVSSQGKIKIFSSSSVHLALHLVCEIVKDKLMAIPCFRV